MKQMKRSRSLSDTEMDFERRVRPALESFEERLRPESPRREFPQELTTDEDLWTNLLEQLQQRSNYQVRQYIIQYVDEGLFNLLELPEQTLVGLINIAAELKDYTFLQFLLEHGVNASYIFPYLMTRDDDIAFVLQEFNKQVLRFQAQSIEDIVKGLREERNGPDNARALVRAIQRPAYKFRIRRLPEQQQAMLLNAAVTENYGHLLYTLLRRGAPVRLINNNLLSRHPEMKMLVQQYVQAVDNDTLPVMRI